LPLIVFDMDGTLIDTAGLIGEHMVGTFRAEGLAIPDLAAIRSTIGLSLPVAMARLADTTDVEVIERLVSGYKALYRAALAQGNDREPFYPGARKALDRLNRGPGNLLGIATGKGLNGVNRILSLHGLEKHFVTLQTPDHNPSKPHPGMLLRAMAETGIDKRETVMIGDTAFDMQLARSAGAMAIGVTWGYHDRQDLLRAGTHVLIDTYQELEPAITRVFG
jgi:phosphoglycolate phosphatase